MVSNRDGTVFVSKLIFGMSRWTEREKMLIDINFNTARLVGRLLVPFSFRSLWRWMG